MIPVGQAVVEASSNDTLYVVLLLVVFLIVNRALWRLPFQPRSGRRADGDQRKLRR